MVNYATAIRFEREFWFTRSYTRAQRWTMIEFRNNVIINRQREMTYEQMFKRHKELMDEGFIEKSTLSPNHHRYVKGPLS